MFYFSLASLFFNIDSLFNPWPLVFGTLGHPSDPKLDFPFVVFSILQKNRKMNLLAWDLNLFVIS